MPIAERIASLAEVAECSDNAEHFSLSFRDFLDGFYPDPSDEKLRDEPADLRAILNDDGYANAYLAATAEYLARCYKLTVPRWSMNPARIVDRPRFAMKTHAGRMFLLLESPPEFRARNIFISADALTRV
ncbi:MAG TPA: hypothetical protein VGO11_03685 [Chthoniobacteraceae bacterium]|jgi:hypothetical protein|nr:hypothetical protein [Chthoniobacteraceae bacterium]